MRLGTHALVALAALTGIGACAPPRSTPERLTPSAIAALESQAAAHPEDRAVTLRLARAYYANDRFADALPHFERMAQAAPTDQETQAYLGLTYEGLTRYDEARAVYTRLLASKPTPGRNVRRLLSGRLELLTRKELQLAARQAIARESLLTHTPPDPNTIAVMPFHYAGGDSTYRPLERGLAAIVVTDLSRVHQLRLVERARVQMLLDELQLVGQGSVDAATGARSGRLVGAAQVVQGQFTAAGGPAAQLRLDATVVRASDVQIAAAGSSADRLQALFDIEKAVVFQLLDKLGITLTPAERVAISERPTRDLQAFLLYSKGLEAEDRGDYAGAARAYQGAARIDPGFRAAGQQAATSQDVQAAASAPATEIAIPAAPEGPGSLAVGGGTLFTAINSAVPSGAVVLQGTAGGSASGPPPSDPNRICEGANCAGPALSTLVGTIIIIVTRP